MSFITKPQPGIQPNMSTTQQVPAPISNPPKVGMSGNLPSTNPIITPPSTSIPQTVAASIPINSNVPNNQPQPQQIPIPQSHHLQLLHPTIPPQTQLTTLQNQQQTYNNPNDTKLSNKNEPLALTRITPHEFHSNPQKQSNGSVTTTQTQQVSMNYTATSNQKILNKITEQNTSITSISSPLAQLTAQVASAPQLQATAVNIPQTAQAGPRPTSQPIQQTVKSNVSNNHSSPNQSPSTKVVSNNTTKVNTPVKQSENHNSKSSEPVVSNTSAIVATPPQKASEKHAAASPNPPIKSPIKLATITTPRTKQTPKKVVSTPSPKVSSPRPVSAASSVTSTSSITTNITPVKNEKVAAKSLSSNTTPSSQSGGSTSKTPKQSPSVQEKEKEKIQAHITPLDDKKNKRVRIPTQPYQSPTPEMSFVTRISASQSSLTKHVDDKLILFYKNEYLAVRNADAGFFLCQTQQNVYKSSPRIRIRWLDQEVNGDEPIFSPDFYDFTDIECVLTTVDLEKVDKIKLKLPKSEHDRIENILKKAIDVEKGIVPRPAVTEEHPDGLDLSLYKDEAQLDKITPRKRKIDDSSDNSQSSSSGKPTSSKKRRNSGKKLTEIGEDDDDTEDDNDNDSDYQANPKKQAKTVLANKNSPAKKPIKKSPTTSPAAIAQKTTPPSTKKVPAVTSEAPESTTEDTSIGRLGRAKRRNENENVESKPPAKKSAINKLEVEDKNSSNAKSKKSPAAKVVEVPKPEKTSNKVTAKVQAKNTKVTPAKQPQQSSPAQKATSSTAAASRSTRSRK